MMIYYRNGRIHKMKSTTMHTSASSDNFNTQSDKTNERLINLSRLKYNPKRADFANIPSSTNRREMSSSQLFSNNHSCTNPSNADEMTDEEKTKEFYRKFKHIGDFVKMAEADDSEEIFQNYKDMCMDICNEQWELRYLM